MLANFSPTGFFPDAMSHLIIAVICGGAIGLDRQLRGKPVGIRSCTIVVITTAMLVDLGNAATDSSGDPSRVMSAIVSGVGFLGGGVILSQGGRVQGVTTAALVWALAAIGIAIGLSFGLAALALTLTLIVLMIVVDWAENRFPRLRGVPRHQKD
ncbi:MgtC/SapB family protein [Tateyamaria pelophila]|uniref:MgtC/SapB family protein n=1 Tax=Tateyamaria pelophila TaxID=328415 RepID=UPI001CBEB403|nr:MgtC/SapB family protein [Tateyamaria pelophila]